jgi:hypothetical protein
LPNERTGMSPVRCAPAKGRSRLVGAGQVSPASAKRISRPAERRSPWRTALNALGQLASFNRPAHAASSRRNEPLAAMAGCLIDGSCKDRHFSKGKQTTHPAGGSPAHARRDGDAAQSGAERIGNVVE